MNGGGFFASNGESCFCCKDSSDATTDLTEMSGYNIYRLNDVILAESKHRGIPPPGWTLPPQK